MGSTSMRREILVKTVKQLEDTITPWKQHTGPLAMMRQPDMLVIWETLLPTMREGLIYE